MREIKFRGKVDLPEEEIDDMNIPHTNGWVVGNLIQNGRHPFIVGDIADIGNDFINHEWWVSVIPESIGQFIEDYDKDNQEIYEGDLIFWDEGVSVVTYDQFHNRFVAYQPTDEPFEGRVIARIPLPFAYTNIIGNTFDHPEKIQKV